MIKKTLYSSLLVLVHALVSKAFVLLVNIYLARSTAPFEYGVFVLIRSIINSIDTIFSASIMPVMIKKAGKGGLNKSVALRFMTLMLILFTGFILQTLLVFVFILSEVLIHQLQVYASIAGYLVLLMLLNGLMTAVLMGNQRYKLLVVTGLVSFASCIVLSILMINSFGVKGALLSLIGFQIMEILIKGSILFNAFKLSKNIVVRINRYIDKELFGACKRIAPLVFASLINSVVFLFARLNLSFEPDGLIQLAFFDVAFQFFIVAMLVLNSVTNIFLAKMSKAPDVNVLNKLLIQNIALVFIFAFLGTSIIYIFSDVLIKVFGEEYSSTELKAMSFCIIPYGFAITFNRYFIVVDERSKLTIISVISGVTMILFLILTAKTAVNLVHGFTIYYLVSALIYFYFIWTKRDDNKTLKKSF
jgi:O-antigen/teichoic acid export membrane protein